MSHKRQYRTPDAKTLSPDDAAQEILNNLAVNHSQLYVPVADQSELIKNTIRNTLESVTQQKKKKQTTRVVANSKASTYSTGLDTKLVQNPMWMPSKPYNLIDAQWCANLVTDNNGVLYRRKATGAYEIIGTIGGRTNGPVASTLATMQNIPDVFNFVKSRIDVLSTLAAKSQEYEQKGVGAFLELEIPLYKNADGTQVSQTLKEFLNIEEDNYPTSIENVISLLVYKFLNDMLPASIFFGLVTLKKYYNILKDENDKDHPVFQGFVVRCGDGTAPTKQGYFSNILDHYQEYLGKIPQRPMAVSNDSEIPSFGVFNQELWDADEKKYGYLTYETSKLVKTFLDPMDADQKNFVCAWFYAMFFCLSVVISILHQDKGGSLKTTVKQIVRNMIKLYYDADVTFVLKLDQLCNVQYLYDSKRMLCIADAMFVDYDEPPVKGVFWEEVKAKTGGAKVDIPIKELYSNPYTVTGSPLFYIGSNKTCFLPDKGAFKRRIACIITTANETWKNIPRADLEKLNNDIEAQKPEFHLLMKLGKQAYEGIISKYGSLSEASVRMNSIASQLDALAPWDEYCERFYRSLFPKDGKDTIKIANDAIDMRLEEWKIKHKTSLKIDHNSVINYFKMIHSDNKTKPFRVNGETVRGWELHRVEQTDENAEECTFADLGLDADGDPIPSIPLRVNSSKFSSNNFQESSEDINVSYEDPSSMFMGM